MTPSSRRRLFAYAVPSISRDDVRDKFTRAGPPPPARAARASVAQHDPSAGGQTAARGVLISPPLTDTSADALPPIASAPPAVDSAALAGAPGGYPAARQFKTGGPGPAQAHVGTDDEQPVQATSAIGVSA